MDLTDFYTEQSYRKEGVEHLFRIRIDTGHPLLAGHFPGRPVVPGACLLQIIRECACRATGRSLRYRVIENCKFSAPVLPDGRPLLVRILFPDAGTLKASAESFPDEDSGPEAENSGTGRNGRTVRYMQVKALLTEPETAAGCSGKTRTANPIF